MRSCFKNKRALIALNYLKKTPTLDEDGYKTGEETIVYGKPFKMMVNISGAKGASAVEVFGTNLDYDKVITMSAQDFKRYKLTDNSVFFIDKKPQYETDGYPLYDYRVKRIAETINEVVIALERVRNGENN